MIGRAYLHLQEAMSIDDLLYHLQHPETLDQLTLHEINQLMIRYPYLESLKLLFEKKLNGQNSPGWNALNLDQRLELASHQAFQSGGEHVFHPPVFDLPAGIPIIEETEIKQEEEDNFTAVEQVATIEKQVTPVEDQITPEPKFQLYPYEESEFIVFLNSLPPTLSKPVAVPSQVSEIEIQATEVLIKESLDLQPNFGTERLADLWVSQGKFQEAITIYEKLSFEYPDKRGIFAAKIEKLKAENSI